LIGDTPFAVTPYIHLHRTSYDVFADDRENPSFGAIVPHVPYPDVYLFGAETLDRSQLEELVRFLAQLHPIAGYLVPVDLVQPIRACRMIYSDVEGLCFTYRQIPQEFSVWRPELVRQLTPADKDLIYSAEKLKMDEIGTNGQKVYLQAYPTC
jgi:hypothetical protein